MNKDIKYISNSAELREVYTPDRRTNKKYNHRNQAIYACITPIEFEAWGKKWHSRRWFINDDNELIFDIRKNHFINLEMFNEGTSAMKNLVAFPSLKPQMSLW